jgi:hypothetical protein
MADLTRGGLACVPASTQWPCVKPSRTASTSGNSPGGGTADRLNARTLGLGQRVDPCLCHRPVALDLGKIVPPCGSPRLISHAESSVSRLGQSSIAPGAGGPKIGSVRSHRRRSGRGVEFPAEPVGCRRGRGRGVAVANLLSRMVSSPCARSTYYRETAPAYSDCCAAPWGIGSPLDWAG